jgi:hypothetical protein
MFFFGEIGSFTYQIKDFKREIRYMHTYNIYVYIYIYIHIYLDGGLEHEWMMFPFHIWDGILPMDELICFKMVQTTNHTYIYTYGGFFMRTPSINGGFGSWEKSSKGWVLEAAMFAKG